MSWEKLTQDITFYAFYVASKVGKTGLTVTVDVWEHTRTGTATEVVSGGSATEIGDGLYKYVLSSGSVDAVGEYIAVFKTADSTVDAQHLPALWIVGRSGVENLDAAVSSRNATAPLDATATQAAAAAALTAYDAATGSDVPSAATVADAVWDEALSGHATAGTSGAALSAAGGAADPLLNAVPGSYAQGSAGYVLGSISPAQVTIASPVTLDGTNVAIVCGDDYLAADSRSLTFSGTNWPVLNTTPTAATVLLKIKLKTGRAAQSATVQSFTATVTGAAAVRVELTDVQTAALSPGLYAYDLEATLSTDAVVTLVQGEMTVLSDVR